MFDVPQAAVTRRRASLTHDGTPVVYSCELRSDWNSRPFRLLAEPGGTAITVSEQIDWSLYVLDVLLGELGWRGAAYDLNAIISQVFPRDPAVVNNWWGGIWLGLAAGPNNQELRIYTNLRYGQSHARWQRVANVLALFGDERIELPLQRLIERATPHATPVGLGLVICKGRVSVLRLYLGVHQPEPVVLHDLLPECFAGARSVVDDIYNVFLKLDGAFTDQGVTVGYDFRRDTNGVLIPEITRVKVDVSCQFLTAGGKAAVLPLVIHLANGWALPGQLLYRFAEDLTACFGGFDPEYISVGLTTRPIGLTVYAKPHGHVRP